MARYLKTGITSAERRETEEKVRAIVERILLEIEQKGDAAVRELSEKFDDWSPESFRLSEGEIQSCLDQVPDQAISDIEFAQEQIRNFAENGRAIIPH